MPARMSKLAAALAIVVLLGCVSSAHGALPIQQFQTTYAAYNPWVAWEWWVPQPQCTETQVVYGSEPAVSGKYPVFIYMHGSLSDYDHNVEGQVITQVAAAQGFVAIAPTYDSSTTNNAKGTDGHANCMFAQGRSTNLISYACALPESDCSHGVVVAGFSQGGTIALRANNFNSQVVAAWAMGVNMPSSSELLSAPAGTRSLPNNKVRLDVGQLDVTGGGSGPLNLSGLQELTGDNCGASYNCLQSDGSGYYVVSNSEVVDKAADHCYWMSVHPGAYSCMLTPTVAGLDPGFAAPSTTPWSLVTSLNWLSAQL
jgi:hypothetical protein